MNVQNESLKKLPGFMQASASPRKKCAMKMKEERKKKTTTTFLSLQKFLCGSRFFLCFFVSFFYFIAHFFRGLAGAFMNPVCS